MPKRKAPVEWGIRSIRPESSVLAAIPIVPVLAESAFDLQLSE